MHWRFGRALALLMMVLSAAACLRPPPFDEARWRASVEKQEPALLRAPHVKDGRFYNPWMPMDSGRFWELVRWRLGPKGTYTEEENRFLPAVVPDLPGRMAAEKGDFIAWIGHNTFLIRIGGQYWLTDPIFSDRALLPKRKTPPALTLEQFNGIAHNLNVLVSHNHYDHLDKNSVLGLPPETRFFVPLGLGGLIESWGKNNVREMDWWQSIELGGGTSLVCLPAQHWSRRIGQGFNESLWASFLLITPSATIYFGGDSGYFVGYREIGRTFPGIDYALLPITAYQPRWFMHYAHMNPEEALDALDDLGARYMIPTQWGTFPLGNEPVGYPVLDLKRVMKARGIGAARVTVMDIGQILPIRPR